MSRTRTVLLAALLAGCGKPDAPPPVAPPPRAAVPPVVAPTAPTAAAAPASRPQLVVPMPPTDRAAAVTAAQQFLTGVAAGTPDLAAVAPEFKRVLAGGDAGRADWATEQYLKGLAGRVSAAVRSDAELAGELVATAQIDATGERPVLRMRKAGDRWQVGWLHVGPAGAPQLLATGDLPQRLAAVAFVETALANQPRLAEAALTPAARGRIAPPLGDDPLGFSRGILSQKLKAFAGGATGYTLTVAGNTASGELSGPGSQKRLFTLTLAAGPDGWLVDDFDPR